MPPQPLTSELVSACQVLFGRKVSFAPGFLSTLDPESLKSTFRARALSTHPDRAAALGQDPAHLEREFCRVKAAYEVLTDHLRRRPAAGSRPGASARRPSRRTPPPREKAAPPRGSARPTASSRPASAKGPSGPRPAAGGRPLSRFWKGSLPQRPLRLGQFLFFSGAIPAKELLDAILWQRQQRPAFGQIARDWGILTSQQVVLVLKGRLAGEAFGECAARLGYMTPFEKHAVACRQKNLQRPFGDYFLERGLLDRAGMEQALLLQRSHNGRFMR